MRTTSRHSLRSPIVILTMLALVLSAVGRAETPPPSMTPTPSPTPSQTPPPQADRAGKNGGANAGAIAGAAIAAAMCAKFMADAQAAREAGNEAAAQNYEMMAMLECAQAAQNAADADKNKEGQNTLQANPSPTMAQISASPLPSTSPEPIPSTSPTPLPSLPPEPEPEETPPVGAAPLPPTEQGSITAAGGSGEAGKEMLEPIDSIQQGYNEQSNGGGSTPSLGIASGYGGVVLGAGATKADQKTPQGISPDDFDKLSSKRFGKNGEEAGGGSGGDGGSGSSGSADKKDNDMLEKLFGQKPGAEGLAFGAPGLAMGDAMGLKKLNGNRRKLNIFEYASLRYRHLAYSDKKLNIRRSIPKLQPPQRTISRAATLVLPAKK